MSLEVPGPPRSVLGLVIAAWDYCLQLALWVQCFVFVVDTSIPGRSLPPSVPCFLPPMLLSPFAASFFIFHFSSFVPPTHPSVQFITPFWTFVIHNKNIGGRYSIFSEVSMLPSFLMGLKEKNFKKNIPHIIKNKKILSQSVKQISKINFNKTKAIVFLNYIPELTNFLYWCQQLMAESLGKNKKGLMPVISTAPKDHHSLLQLYLDGPKDKLFYVFSSENKSKLKINTKFFGSKVKYLNKKKYERVKLSQKNAFISVLKEKKIPFREITIKKFDEKTLGKLFFLFIFETIVFSKILKVNPYDQPGVERVKILTKKILS